VLHFWSLAVEEQFYLVWPLALGAMFLATRAWGHARQLQVIRAIVVVGALASAIWALSLRSSNPDRAYYGTDTRAYELLAGALIALVPSVISAATRFRRSTRVATLASVAAVVLLATSWVHLDAIERGVAITIVTVALIVSLEAAEGGIAQRALSTHAMTYLGKISYGTYLWHWIVILVIVTKFPLSTTATILLACLIATGLSALSFEILEHPVRRSARLEPPQSHGHRDRTHGERVVGTRGDPKIVDPAQASAPGLRGATTSGFTPVPANLDLATCEDGGAQFVDCLGKPATACTIVHGTVSTSSSSATATPGCSFPLSRRSRDETTSACRCRFGPAARGSRTSTRIRSRSTRRHRAPVHVARRRTTRTRGSSQPCIPTSSS